MKIKKTKFKGLLIFESKKFNDNRGYFRELGIEKIINKKLIFSIVSKSRKNVLRGLHMQKNKQQGNNLTKQLSQKHHSSQQIQPEGSPSSILFKSIALFEMANFLKDLIM